MTLFNRITLGLIALVAIVAVVGVFAVSQFDFSRQKAQLETRVFEHTGRQLQIAGDLKIRLFPRPGLSLTEVSLSNAEGFADPEFATIRSAEFQVAAAPLLAGRIKIEKVILHGLTLKLQRNADGKTNWDDLMATTAVVETVSDENVVREIEASAPIIAALSAGDMQIMESAVSYSDERDESFIALNNLDLATGTFVLSEPFSFESEFNFINSTAAGVNSSISADGEIAVDLVNNIYALQQLNIDTVTSGTALPIDPLPLSAQGELVADLNAANIDITLVDGLLTGVPISGEFQVADWEDNIHLTGLLSSGEFNAMTVLDQFTTFSKDQIPDELLESAQVSARLDYSDDVLRIEQFEASVSDLNFNGDFQIANPTASGVLSGRLQSNPFNPAPWASIFGVAFNDDSVMQQAQLSADIRQSGQLLSFNQIELQLDDTNISGSIEVSDIHADSLPVTYALSVDKINVDRYLPAQVPAPSESQTQPQPESQGQSPTRSPVQSDNTTPDADARQSHSIIPVEALRQLKLDGEIAIAEITLGGVSAQNSVIPLVAENGRIEITEATADLYSGSFFSTASLDVQSDEPLLTVTGNMNSLNAETLLQDALGSVAPLTGIANLSIDILARGLIWSRMLEHANGALSLSVTDGTLTGIDITAELHEAGVQFVSSQEVDSSGSVSVSPSDNAVALADKAQNKGPETNFSELSMSAILADSVLTNEDLIFTSPHATVMGEGGINLSGRTIDYLLHLSVNSNLKTQQAQTQQPLLDVELTIPVRGRYSALTGDLPRLLVNTFKSGIVTEVKTHYTGSSASQREGVQEQIALEKDDLRLRLEKEQQEAAENSRQEKQQDEASTEDLLQQIEIEKNALRKRLQKNLEKDHTELLSEY